MSRPRNCRHCAFMCCGDANWCGEHEETMSDRQISTARKCPDWQWCEIDALTLVEWREHTPQGKRAVPDGQTRLEVD